MWGVFQRGISNNNLPANVYAVFVALDKHSDTENCTRPCIHAGIALIWLIYGLI